MNRILDISAKIFSIAAACMPLYGCGGGKTDGSVKETDGTVRQITENDVTELDGTLSGCMLESWEPVFLDDSKEALIGNTNEVAYDDGRFFVYSSSSWDDACIMVFDSTGHYLNRIGHHGNAAFEYSYLQMWFLDTKNRRVAIFDGNQNVIKYFDYDGKYCGKSSIGEDEAGMYRSCRLLCLSDSLLISQNYMSGEVADDFTVLSPDGRISPLFERNGYKLANEGRYGSPMAQFGSYVTDAAARDQWLMRPLDNHLYHVTDSNAVECVANLKFKDGIPEKVKMEFPIRYMGQYSEHFMNQLVNMRDFVLIWYSDGIVAYDKESSQFFTVHNDDDNSSVRRVPDIWNNGCFGNTIIGIVDMTVAYHIISGDESDEEENDAVYSEEVMDFYRKAAGRENPTLVLYHLKSPTAVR